MLSKAALSLLKAVSDDVDSRFFGKEIFWGALSAFVCYLFLKKKKDIRLRRALSRDRYLIGSSELRLHFDTLRLRSLRLRSVSAVAVRSVAARSDHRIIQKSKNPINIGRNEDCEIFIDDILLSRIHCTLQFVENIGWTIKDGYSAKVHGRNEYFHSTNGSWIYLIDDMEIYEGFVFKNMKNIFECSLINLS